jgi:hypothetical protein
MFLCRQPRKCCFNLLHPIHAVPHSKISSNVLAPLTRHLLPDYSKNCLPPTKITPQRRSRAAKQRLVPCAAQRLLAIARLTGKNPQNGSAKARPKTLQPAVQTRNQQSMRQNLLPATPHLRRNESDPQLLTFNLLHFQALRVTNEA